MTDEDILAVFDLVNWNVSLKMISESQDNEGIAGVQAARDRALVRVKARLSPEQRAEVERQMAQATSSTRDRETGKLDSGDPLGFRLAAVVIAVATAAAVGAAPLAAWVVKESIIVETIKAGITASIAGGATLGAEAVVHNMQRKANDVLGEQTSPQEGLPAQDGQTDEPRFEDLPERESKRLGMGELPRGRASSEEEGTEAPQPDETRTTRRVTADLLKDADRRYATPRSPEPPDGRRASGSGSVPTPDPDVGLGDLIP